MTTYAKRKLKYSWNENFNLLHYVEWNRFVTLAGSKSGLRVTLSYLIMSDQIQYVYTKRRRSISCFLIQICKIKDTMYFLQCFYQLMTFNSLKFMSREFHYEKEKY